MIYIILSVFLLTAFSAIYLLEKETKYGYALVGLALILIAAFRDGADVDYRGYVDYYNNIEQETIEPTFHLICYLVKIFFFDNVVFLFLIYALLGVSLKLIAIKQLTRLSLLSVAMYISFYYILHDMTQIRAGVASGILLLCVKPLFTRNLKKFLFLAIIASLFHYSALIIFLLWFISPNSLNKNKYACLIPLGYVCYFAGISMSKLLTLLPFDAVQAKVEAYFYLTEFSDGPSSNVFNVLFLLRCFIAYVILWKVDFIALSNKYTYLLLKIYFLSLFSFLLFADIPGFAFRISELLGIVEIILFPLMIYIYTPRRISILFPLFVGQLMLSLSLFITQLIKN